MITFINTTDIQIEEPTVVSIGKFDGEHRGHQKIFQNMRRLAKEQGLKTAIFTFHTAPADIVEGVSRQKIHTNEERRERLREEGMDYLIEYPFTKEIASLTGEIFLKDILIGKMNMKAIVAGDDVAFGYQKSGNIELLQHMQKELNFKMCIIEKEKDEDNNDISSSLIKELLLAGDIEKANDLLGSPLRISGEVVPGNHIGGAVLGFPTINILPPQDKQLPRYGVYATKIKIEDEKKEFYGITNIGINPSVKRDKQNHITRMETHIFDFAQDIYGKKAKILFYKFIRPEMKFADMDDLKKQIEKDKEEVREYFKKVENLQN